MERRAILVLGMHRSGTSAVARVLGLCGATLPRETLSENQYNPAGYWEPAAVVALHDEILRSAGSSFDDIGVPGLAWQASVAASDFGRRLAEALEAAYGEASLWVVKDPRLCRLVPLWKDVLARLGVTPVAVIPIRNPLEVADSLAERDGFSVAKSLLLWLRHFLEAEVATRGMRRSFVTYDSLLRDWRRVMRRIGRDLDVAWPLAPESVAPQVDEFLDARARHHVRPDRDLALDPRVSAWVGVTYTWAVEASKRRPPATARIDAVRKGLSTADAMFLPLLSEASHERSRLEERAREGEQLADVVREFEATLETSQTESTSLRAAASQLESRVAQLGAALAGRTAEIEGLRHQVDDASRDGAELAALLELATTSPRSGRNRPSSPSARMNGDPGQLVVDQLAFLARLRDRYGITLDYESILEKNYRRLLKRGNVAADIGAHRGRHAAVLASIVGDSGMVLAFEPLPAEFAELQRLAGELPQLRLYNVALANDNGESEFVFAAGTPSESGLRERIFNAPDIARPTRIRVQVGRFDDYAHDLTRLDFVKIDIEGGEIDCLKGGVGTIARLRPVISVEYGASSYAAYGHERATLFELASQLGYAIVDLFGNVIESLPLWENVCDNVYWDYILVPRERRDECVRSITGRLE